MAIVSVSMIAKIIAVLSLQIAPPVTYKFVAFTDKWVGVMRGEVCLLGRLDANGDFTELSPRKYNTWSAGVPAHFVINGGPAWKGFEFRSGILIPGEIQDDGRFVPEVGGKIIKFSDYKYSPTGPRIWNLPGYFVPVRPGEK